MKICRANIFPNVPALLKAHSSVIVEREIVIGGKKNVESFLFLSDAAIISIIRQKTKAVQAVPGELRSRIEAGRFSCFLFHPKNSVAVVAELARVLKQQIELVG